MVVEGRVAQLFQARSKFLQSVRFHTPRNRHFDGRTKIKGFESLLMSKLRVAGAIFRHDAKKVAAKFGKGKIVADVEPRQVFRQLRPVARGQDPLGKVVGEAFSEEMMTAQGLKGMVEDRCIAAKLQAFRQFRESDGLMVANSRQVRRGDK